jgi:prepilin-type N-terminal cleavage/methylation domain-containing protein
MQRRYRQTGYSLVEALIALAVFGLIMVGAFTLYASNQDAYRVGQSQAEVQQNARVALEAAAREVRLAGYDLSGVLSTLTPPTAIQVANQSDLTFVADVTGDDVLDQVSYKLQGGRLVRELSSWNGSSFPTPVAGELADGLGLLTFAYFDDTTPTNTAIAAPVATSSLDDIRRITISVVAADTIVGAQQTFPLVVDVQLRN